MSAEVSEEFVADEAIEVVDPIRDRIREQMKIASAVSDYVEAAEKFESASKCFNESCNAVRDILKSNTTVVIRSEYGRHYAKHYLLTSDSEGNFDIKLVEVI